MTVRLVAGAMLVSTCGTQAYPTKLLLDHDGPGGSIGHIWYSAYLANYLGRLDAATGAVDEVPLPPNIGPQGAFWHSSGPWDLVATAGGAILFNEQFSAGCGGSDRGVSRISSKQARRHGGGQIALWDPRGV